MHKLNIALLAHRFSLKAKEKGRACSVNEPGQDQRVEISVHAALLAIPDVEIAFSLVIPGRNSVLYHRISDRLRKEGRAKR